ncbi:aldose 1-epimerase family protein [uncultured Bacteroides sp.]|uniref:aldose 1-epimerase family protein n=1 Tax=uncultured Bacteroides sp. TaxID=162156 RepID=UPI00260DC7CE|nr:aldose 1-epimerase family protein [uncultured Bacteroides sp.]
MKTLSNDVVSIQIADSGAELVSICANGTEYLWQADPKFWARHSPVLFPLVGRVWNNEYRHEGKTYSLGQHGFARDMEFQLTYEEENALIYTLESNEETLKVYPFKFVFEVGYRLKGNHIEVMWSVQNPGDENLYFQIGAHPAFYYRDLDLATQERGFLDFGKKISTLEYISPAEKGCVSDKRRELFLNEGLMELTSQTFDCDTYIFDNSQVKKVTLLDKEKNPYISIECNSPLLAVWSPSAAHPDVPFVCLEPWYGRCDKVGFNGEFKDREWMQCIAPDKSFTAGYTIILEDVKAK